MWSYQDIIQAFVVGKPVGNLTRDEVLDNITYTWLTNTGVSSARLYAEDKLGLFDVRRESERRSACQRVRGRALPGTARLDRARLLEPRLQQRARPRRPLRRLARAAAVH
jgi:hypothetical protein